MRNQWQRFGDLVRTRLALLLVPVALLAALSCTPEQAQLLEGILQGADAVDGQITIVTKDGRTVVLTIATEAAVETEDGTSGALEGLEPGTQVRVRVDEDGRVAQHIKARQAKAEGTITQIEGNAVTIETERGRKVTVVVTDSTRIKLEDDIPGTLQDLRVGTEAEAKFDPKSGRAFKISLEEEEAEIEGRIIALVESEITIETERGRKLTLVVTPGTRIDLDDDFPGRVQDLRNGMRVEAKFDPMRLRAFKIEVEDENAKIKGTVASVEGQKVTIESEGGHRRTLTVSDRTRIKVKGDDFPGRVEDLQEGIRVEAEFDPRTNAAFQIEVKD